MQKDNACCGPLRAPSYLALYRGCVAFTGLDLVQAAWVALYRMACMVARDWWSDRTLNAWCEGVHEVALSM
jgi:hypothetical protein